jgi:hypothetical protein
MNKLRQGFGSAELHENEYKGSYPTEDSSIAIRKVASQTATSLTMLPAVDVPMDKQRVHMHVLSRKR